MLDFVEVRDHVIICKVVHPEPHEDSKDAEEHAWEAADVWQQVESRIGDSQPAHQVHVNLYLERQPDIIVDLVWHGREQFKAVHIFVPSQCERVQLNRERILELKLGKFNLVALPFSDPATEGHVVKFGLPDESILIISAWVETNRVVEENDELLLEPVSDLLLTLAVGPPLTHLEHDHQVLGFLRIVVAPEGNVFIVHTLEPVLPRLQWACNVLVGREDGCIRARFETQLLIRAIVRTLLVVREGILRIVAPLQDAED